MTNRPSQDVSGKHQLQIADHETAGWRDFAFNGECGGDPVPSTGAFGVQFALSYDRILPIAQLHCRNAAPVYERGTVVLDALGDNSELFARGHVRRDDGGRQH